MLSIPQSNPDQIPPDWEVCKIWFHEMPLREHVFLGWHGDILSHLPDLMTREKNWL